MPRCETDNPEITRTKGDAPMADDGGLALMPWESRDGRMTSRPRGGTVALKAAAADTRGAYSMLEFEAPPRAGWLGAHIHHAEEEGIYVLFGRLHVRLGEEQVVAPAGSFILVPRGMVHAHANLDEEPARYLALFSPPGMEAYFEELDSLLASATPGGLDQVQLAALAQRYHMEAAAPST